MAIVHMNIKRSLFVSQETKSLFKANLSANKNQKEVNVFYICVCVRVYVCIYVYTRHNKWLVDSENYIIILKLAVKKDMYIPASVKYYNAPTNKSGTSLFANWNKTWLVHRHSGCSDNGLGSSIFLCSCRTRSGLHKISLNSNSVCQSLYWPQYFSLFLIFGAKEAAESQYPY